MLTAGDAGNAAEMWEEQMETCECHWGKGGGGR